MNYAQALNRGKNKKFLGVLFLSALLVFQTISNAFAPVAMAADDDEYNFSWLDPDKKIYVLQNRKFRKARKVQLSLLAGAGIAETYRSSYEIQPRLGYWVNEDWGLEVFYSARTNSENNTYKALANAIGGGAGGLSLSPLIREVNSMFGGLFNWAPWYAKINVFNTILYFDWYFSAGVGQMMTSVGPATKAGFPSLWKDENLFAFFLGTGQLFHLSEKFDARLDFLGHFYSADIYGGVASAPPEKSVFSNFVISAGIGVKL